MRGKLITFEGGEGSGKSTQARLLAEHLAKTGHKALMTREPGGSPFAERLRAFILDPAVPAHTPLAEALLFYAARADHLAASIRPALEAGTWVICDRFSDSTRVYQGAAGGLEAGTLEALEQLVVGRLGPDLTLLLDIAPAAGLARAERRRATEGDGARDSYEGRDLAYHERLRAGFLALARAEPDRIAIVDAAATPGEISARIRELVAARLGVAL